MASSLGKCSVCGVAISTEAPYERCQACMQNLPTKKISQKPGADISTTSALSPLKGTRIRYFGDYELLGEIARGGMGVVYKARQIRLNRLVAVKMILDGALTNETAIRRFYIEAQAAANLQHPNIVAIHEIGEHDGQHFFSMDYIEGKNLAKVMGGKPLLFEQASRYMMIIAGAIHYSHTHGTLHRDLKPSNILIDVNDQPQITDFGLAKRIDGENNLTMSGTIMGTPSYMPPEQICGENELVDARSDVYSLGALLYELITGHAPFLAATLLETLRMVQVDDPVSPRLINKAVPVDLETICLKCLEKSQKKRYDSADDLAADLRRFLNNEPIRARPVGPLERVAKWARRRPAFAGLISVCILAIIGFITGGIWYNAKLSTARDEAREEAGRARLAEDAARIQQTEAEKARKEAEHNLAYAELAQAGMFTDAKRFTEAYSLYLSSQEKLLKLGENDFPAKVGLTELYAVSPPALLTLRGHAEGVLSVAISDDGEYALSGSYDRDMKLWEVKTGREIRTFKGHQATVSDVAFSPDGRWALSGSADKTAKLWDIATGKERWTAMKHLIHVRAVAFTPDIKWAVTAAGKELFVWEVSSGNLVRSFSWEQKNYVICGIAVSPDGQHLITAANQDQDLSDNTVIMWDLATGKDLRHFKGHLAFGAAFSPDGRMAVSGGIDKTISLWDISTSKEIRTLTGHRNPVQRVAFSPDGTRILSCGWEPTVRLWDVASGQEIRTFAGHNANVYGSDYSPDGRYILSGSADKTLKFWEIEPVPEIRTFAGHEKTINTVKFSPDGKLAVSASSDGTVRVWDIVTGFEIRKFAERGDYATLSADGTLAFGVSYTNLRLWQMETGKEIRTIPGRFYQGSIAPDGRTALSGCYRPVEGLILWDLATGEKIREVKNGNTGTTSDIAFLPDGMRAISCNDSTLTLWDVNTGQAIRTFRGHNNRATCVAVSRDGAYALSGGWDQTLRLWEIGTGQTIRIFPGHEGHVYGVAFSPDGQWAVSGSSDSTARIWNVQSGEEAHTLSWEKEYPSSVAFSPDGNSVLIGTTSGVFSHWDFSRPEQHRNYTHLLDAAHITLTKDENDSAALKVMGEYYAFRHVNDWAVQMLERARKGGAQVSALTLARCYWVLSKNAAFDEPARLRYRTSAITEFRKELARLKDQPVLKKTDAKESREQEELYLNLCLKTILMPDQGD